MGRMGALFAAASAVVIATFAVLASGLIPHDNSSAEISTALGTAWFLAGGVILLFAAVLVARMKLRARRATRVAAFSAVPTEQPLVAAAA